MPMIERVEEVVEELCNLFGVYGAHEHGKVCPDDPRKMCRMCFSSLFSDRFRKAAENERKMDAAGL